MLSSSWNTSVLGWLTQCTFGEKIAQGGIYQFWVIKILLEVQMFIDIIEFWFKKPGCFSLFNHSQFHNITVSMMQYSLGNHKYMASH